VARCTAERSISPLRVGEEVEVVGMAPEEECQHEMFVLIRWERRALAVPLAQLEGVAVDEQTRQVIEDWQYWVAQGYSGSAVRRHTGVIAALMLQVSAVGVVGSGLHGPEVW
jgi:predicted  nucleic acid-binding Zn ribbon protein